MVARGPGTAKSRMDFGGQKGYGGSGRYLENCAHVKVDIEVLECLMEPENQDMFLRYILKYTTRGGSNIFQLFDTSKRQDHFVASRRRWLESQGRQAARQESGQNEWYDVEYQGAMAKKTAVLRQVPENAVAAAKLAVSQRRRRPMWESESEALSEDDNVSSTSRESNTCNDALHVVGFHVPGDKISLFLKDWELAQVALSCHMALDVLCQEMHEAWETCGCQMSLVLKKG